MLKVFVCFHVRQMRRVLSFLIVIILPPLLVSLPVSPSSHVELRKRVKENVTHFGYNSCHFPIVNSFDQCQLDHS